MKRGLTLGVLLVLSAALASPLWADLSDLKDKVDQAQTAPDDEDDDDTSSTSDDGDDDSSNTTDGSFFFFEVLRFLGTMWAWDNVFTTYGGHPLAEGGFVRLPQNSPSAPPGEFYPVTQAGRNGWLSVQTEGVVLDGLGQGVQVGVQGHFFRFIGPLTEALVLRDGHDSLTSLRAGARLALVQSDPFNVSFYGQWVGWLGILEKKGGAWGFDVQSFLAPGLDLEARIGQLQIGNFVLTEAQAQAGWHWGATEVYGGWRNWQPDPETIWQGPYFGVRQWF